MANEVREVKANLFGGYTSADDPWASGGYTPSNTEPEPGQAPTVPIQDPPEPSKPKTEARQYLLQCMVDTIRDQLRELGVKVALASEAPVEVMCDAVSYNVSCLRQELEDLSFVMGVRQRMVLAFVNNNPDNKAMYTCVLPLPKGVEWAVNLESDGLSLRMLESYDISTDEFVIRMDCLYALSRIGLDTSKEE
jgi:hypothetical protein